MRTEICVLSSRLRWCAPGRGVPGRVGAVAVVLATLLLLVIPAAGGAQPPTLTTPYMTLGMTPADDSARGSAVLQIFLLMTVLSLAPAILTMVEQAATAFQSALERFPGSDLLGHAPYWQGMCQVARHDWDQATETLRTALDKHPQHALAAAMTYWLADALRQRGDLKAAQDMYAQVVQNWPESEWADDSLHMQILVALAESSYDRVVSLGDKFQTQYPASPFKAHVDHCLGRGCLKQKQYGRAIEILKPLVETAAATDAPGEPVERVATTASDDALDDG